MLPVYGLWVLEFDITFIEILVDGPLQVGTSTASTPMYVAHLGGFRLVLF